MVDRSAARITKRPRGTLATPALPNAAANRPVNIEARAKTSQSGTQLPIPRNSNKRRSRRQGDSYADGGKNECVGAPRHGA
jgi:hypothetical protein